MIMKLRRLNNILDYVKTYGVCSYDNLCEHFNVSLSTIRRDIDELEKEEKIEKVYGGVKLTDSYKNEDFNSGLYKYDFAKDNIAKKACELIEDGDIVLLGSGSTVAHMIKHLKERRNITLITNNLAVLNETLNCNFNVVGIGGNLDKTTMSFVGLQSIKQLEQLNANKCFISCNGINQHTITNVTDLEADIKKTQINISDKIVLLADHNKFNNVSLYSFANINDIDYLITDNKLTKEYDSLCKENKCEVLIAK